MNALTVNGLTFTATRLTADDATDNRYSVRCSGSPEMLAALDLGALDWPRDTAISSLCGEAVRYEDCGDDLLEGIWRTAKP